MNAIVTELNAAGAEMRDCCARLDERDAERFVINTGTPMYLIDGQWIASAPSGFVGWAIKPSRYSNSGVQKFWMNANGSHSTCKPAEPDAMGIAMRGWVEAGHTLD